MTPKSIGSRHRFRPAVFTLLCAALAAPPPSAVAAEVHAAPAVAPTEKKGPHDPAELEPSPLEALYAQMRKQLRAPSVSEDFPSTPVAKIDDEVITAGQLAAAVAGAHGDNRSDAKAGLRDLRPLLDRLVDARLIVLEARDEGIDELPQIKAQIEKIEETKLKDILKAKAWKDLKVDQAQVDRAYREAVKEYRIHALSFEKEDDARQVAARMKQGKGFAEVAQQLVKEKKAQDRGDGYVSGDKLLPEVKAVLEKAKPGTVTAPLKASGSWLVALFTEARRRDDPKLRADIEAAQLSAELSKKHAKVDRKLLRAIDYDAPKPGVAALAKDRRALARLEGGKQVTVADLTAELDKQFFHGIEDAAKKKRANQKKEPIFESLLFRLLLVDEAARQRLRETDEFKKPVREATERFLFGAFLENAIAPTLQVTEAECRKYYDEHKAEFTTPAFVQLEGLAFAQAKDAQAAVAKLKAGTDFRWMKEHADGLVPAGKQNLQFEAMPVTLASLPEGLAKSLHGAKEGDYRLHASADGESYVVRLAKEFPAGLQPFQEVQEGIKKRLFSQKVTEAVKGWADKIRQHHDVQVYLGKAGG